MPKNQEYYDFYAPRRKPVRQERIFIPIKSDRGGWLVYSCDSGYVEIGEKVFSTISGEIYEVDESNVNFLKGNIDFLMISMRLISTKLILGSLPEEIRHNVPFKGLDWTSEEEKAVIFLKHVKNIKCYHG